MRGTSRRRHRSAFLGRSSRRTRDRPPRVERRSPHRTVRRPGSRFRTVGNAQRLRIPTAAPRAARPQHYTTALCQGGTCSAPALRPPLLSRRGEPMSHLRSGGPAPARGIWGQGVRCQVGVEHGPPSPGGTGLSGWRRVSGASGSSTRCPHRLRRGVLAPRVRGGAHGARTRPGMDAPPCRRAARDHRGHRVAAAAAGPRGSRCDVAAAGAGTALGLSTARSVGRALARAHARAAGPRSCSARGSAPPAERPSPPLTRTPRRSRPPRRDQPRPDRARRASAST